MKKVLSLFLSLLMLISAISLTSLESFAASDKTVTISFEAKEMYDYANEVLALVNKERAAVGVDPLTMDSSLLESAMLRSAEIVVLFDHTRPNGSSCATVNSKLSGENIASGYNSPEIVVEGWMGSTGHKNNILNPNYKSIGIGCVVYGGLCHWAQSFSRQDGDGKTKTGTVNKTESVTVSTSNISLYFNSSTTGIDNTRYPNGFKPSIVSLNTGWDSRTFPVDTSLLDFKSSDPSVFTVSADGTIKIVSSGTATFTASLKADPSVSVSKELSVVFTACPNGHTIVVDKAVAPSCKKTGLTEGKHCSVCNTVITAQQIIPATGHKYMVEVEEPTCTQAGFTIYTCEVCADGYTIVSADPIDHNIVTKPAVAATCTKSGLTEGKYCSMCGKVTVAQQTVPATGHKYTVKVTAPTCIERGYTTHTCGACGDSYIDSYTPMTDHTVVINKAVAPTCNRTGLTEGKSCSVCGKVIVAQKIVDATGHKYTAKVTAPTCTEQGCTTHTCSVCGDIKVDSYTPATGHTTVLKNNTAVTCTSNGYTGDTVCTKCNAVVTKGSTIKALGHNYKTSVEKASLSKDGKIVNTCSRCNDKKVTSTISKVAEVKLSRTTINYVGTVQRPTVTVKDSKGNSLVYKQDFTVDYSDWNSTNAGEYTVTVNFVGDYEDSRTYTYKIVPQTNAVPKLNRNVITTNGTVQRPLVTVTDAKGKALTYKQDFTVDYSDWNSTNVGRYTVTVTMQGNYSGSYTYPYYINPKPTTFWTSAQGGFKAIKNGFTLTWNKQASQTTGYQLQYATKRDFSNAASVWIEDPNVTSRTITGRAGNTRYYVRIRPYTKIGNGTFYGSWDYEGNYIKSVVTL